MVCQGSYVHFYELTGFDLLNSLLLLPVLGFYLSRGLEILCLGTITGTGPAWLIRDRGKSSTDKNRLLALAGLALPFCLG